jgi:heat shock protein 1/8
MDTVIGLDFGSHNASLALWHAEKGSYEVFADELGSRVIPCAVAYRGEEVIVGLAALSQSHKNPSNTFLDVRDLILDTSVENVHVPVLEKEIPVQELVSHFFRNIHNQVKQQVGKIVRECVVSLPASVSAEAKDRLVESAQAGGIRIKGFITDSSSALVAYGFDDPNSNTASARSVVIDIGWSETKVSVYTTSGGMFFHTATSTSSDICGKVLVKVLTEHCAKDFQRRAKVSCVDSTKSMIRLRTLCEETVKQLSTSQEASVDIDSLFEGIDYSGKISRARFEDLAGIPLMRLKNLIAETLAQAEGLSHADVNNVCLAGGVVAVPKIIATIKSLFPNAAFSKARFETSECLCIGAALHARYLLEQVRIARAAPLIINHANLGLFM